MGKIYAKIYQGVFKIGMYVIQDVLQNFLP